MLRRDANKIENYFEAFLIISLLIIFFYMIKDYLMPIFLAATIVFLFYEPYKKLAKKAKSKTVSALFIMFIVTTLILVPVYIVSLTLIIQTSNLIHYSSDVYNTISWDSCTYSFCPTIKNNIQYIDFKLEDIIQKIGIWILGSMSNIFSSISNFLIDIALFALAFFYLLIDGENFIKYIKRLIPMKEEYKNALLLRFKEVSKAVFLDSLFVAIVQGTLIGIGFKIVGISNPVFWGTLASFFALIPIVGTTAIWIPGTLYLLFSGNWVSALILAIYSIIVVGLSDNVIRMFDLNKKIKMHPFLILISVLGGMNLFGFFGLFLGPIVVSLIASIFQLYKLEFD